jgi:hypothetical protein
MNTSPDRLIVAGSLVFAIAALVQLSSASNISKPLLVTSFALSIALPMLTGALLMITKQPQIKFLDAVPYPMFAYATGLLATWVALTGLFFHLHSISGFLFMALSIMALLFAKAYDHSLKHEVQQTATEPNDETINKH